MHRFRFVRIAGTAMAKQTRAPKRAAKAALTHKPAKRAVAKAATKSSVRKPTKGAAKAAANAALKTAPRRKQRVAISHYREEDFVADDKRAYAVHRDLGVAAASHGLASAQVIRLIGPGNTDEVSKLHYHDAEFQLIYVLNGWVKCYVDGEGEMTMRQGSCWTQPPRTKHMIRDYSDNCELLEVILPAEHRTIEVRG
jgi:mannose-6-phosphate isomerase-like protein (cupin superfamily)